MEKRPAFSRGERPVLIFCCFLSGLNVFYAVSPRGSLSVRIILIIYFRGCFTETLKSRLFFFQSLPYPTETAIFAPMKYVLEENEARCLECGDPLPYGRTDRKYCSDRCRSRYHNREHLRWRRRFAWVTGILERNYEILDHLVRMGVTSIAKTDLAQLGYNGEFLTSCRKTGHRMVCHCFDIRFEETPSKFQNLSQEPFSGEDGV